MPYRYVYNADPSTHITKDKQGIIGIPTYMYMYRIVGNFHGELDDSGYCCLLTLGSVGRPAMMFWPCPSSWTRIIP